MAIAHDDPGYKHFFGELLLAFEMSIGGEVQELVFVRYLFPHEKHMGNLPAEDGISLTTRCTRAPARCTSLHRSSPRASQRATTARMPSPICIERVRALRVKRLRPLFKVLEG